jgi:hypothetical protein
LFSREKIEPLPNALDFQPGTSVLRIGAKPLFEALTIILCDVLIPEGDEPSNGLVFDQLFVRSPHHLSLTISCIL